MFERSSRCNVRVVADKDGKVEETNDYYPFGGMFTTSTDVQPYKYNGKELDRASGLSLYDYGARYYDATIGRWCMVDSLSEKYYSFNSYNYCGNNPARYVDPDGNGWNETWPFFKESLEASFSVGLRVEASTKIKNIGVKLGLNAGSIEYGNQGQRITSGISTTAGIVGVEMYENAYDINPSMSVKEEGYSVGSLVWDEDHKTTTIYDSSGGFMKN